MNFKKICVVGLGYIGLPTAALLANRGYEVVGVEISSEVISKINAGEIHIIEPELDSYVEIAVNNKKLLAKTSPEHADVFIICVPTPVIFKDQEYIPDISYVEDAMNAISPFLNDGSLVILESTSPVGTTRFLEDRYRKSFGLRSKMVHFAYCPERVLPGKIMKELVNNDRVVGGVTQESTDLALNFYRTFVDGEVIGTTAETAEMCKLTENSYRDVNIAFANELSMLCAAFNVDARQLISLANRHPRVDILSPGPGVGGHCIAVDPWFLVSANPENANLIKMARNVNISKENWTYLKISSEIETITKKIGKRPVIALFGLAFKPDIDDLRESPAVNIARKLKDQNCTVICVEPNMSASNEFKLVSIAEAIRNADILVVLVKHREFMQISFNNFLADKVVLDFVGITD